MKGQGNAGFSRHWKPQASACALVVLLVAAVAVAPSTIQFIDRAKTAGLSVLTYTGGADKDHILESTGNGVVAFDYDSDSDLDLYFVNAFRFPKKGQTESHANVLYQNNGKGVFTDVTSKAGVGAAVYGQGGCVGDYDSDNLPDLYVANFGPDILYHNNGNGTFSDVTAKAGVGDPRWGVACAFFDADQDGDHDLYVTNYIEATWKEVHSAKRARLWRGKVEVLDGPKGLPGSRNTFYLNNGNGTFTDATEKAGFLPGADYYSMGVVSFDYDNDKDSDVYVANDSTPNCLYRNRGNGTFEEVGTITGSAYSADGQEQGSMGVGFGDYDNDGWFDLIVTNFAHDYDTLYRNLKGQFFQDVSFHAGIAVPTFVPLAWGTFFFDADLDRDLDLFVVNGHIYPQVDRDQSLNETYRQTNTLYLNQGGKFRDVSPQSGEPFRKPKSGRGAAYGDFDNDGDIDIAISNQDEAPTLLENRSDRSGNHWVTLQLLDIHGSALALGARVVLTAGGLSQHRQVASGGSYASQNDFRLHFGLGSATTIDRIVIRWPDSKEETLTGLSVDRIHIIKRK